MLMLMEFNYEWLLLCLMEYCDYFKLIKLFKYNEANLQETDLDLVKDRDSEIISKWYGSNGKIGIKNDYVCNHRNYLNLLQYNNIYCIDKDTDILFYKKDDCMFFTMSQDKISYMSDNMYEIYSNKLLDQLKEEIKVCI